MESKKTLLEVLDDISSKKEYIFTITEVVRELTQRAAESNVSGSDEAETRLISVGYELDRMYLHIENLHHIIYDLNKDLDTLITKAIELSRATKERSQ